MSLHFDITADNSSFMERMNEIKIGIQNASGVITNLSKNFDVSTVENKIIALNKVIRDNESAMLQSSKQIKKWELDAQEAFNNNDLSTFNAITKDIEDQAAQLAELSKETKQYYDTLEIVMSSGGIQPISFENIEAPKFFRNQDDYEYAESLRTKIAQLQDQISNFDGSDADLQTLRTSLSKTQGKLRDCELAAVQAASELGGNLGSRAAQASESMYILNSEVERQEAVVKALTIAVQEASAALGTLQQSGDTSAIDDAQIKYDSLSISLQNARTELANLQAAQIDASAAFSQINQEIETHDSLMVNMLGGYENYQAIIGQLPAPIQGVIGSLNGMTGAAKAFVATPLGAIITVIVLALQALKTWFDSSVEGQKAFAEISGYVSGVLDQLKEIVITVGKAIYNAFSDPKKAVTDLWNAIKTNFINRFKSIGEIAKSLGGLLKAALTLDGEGIKREFSNFTNSLLKFGTGIDDVIGKVSKYVKGVNDAAKANARLSKTQKEIDIDESEENKKSSRRQLEMTKLRTKMYDSKASKKDKQAARDEYIRLNNEDIQAKLALQDRKIALQKEKMSLTTNSIEDENALRDLEAQRTQIENQGAQKEMMLQRMSNRLDKTSKQTGKTSAQISAEQEKAHQKLLDLMKRQAEERLKLQQDYEYQEWQNRIDLMEEGEEKVLAQMRLDNKKELSSLAENRQQAINAEISRQKSLFDAGEDEKAAGNKNYTKKIFDPSSVYDPDNNVVSNEIQTIVEQYDNLHGQLLQKQHKAESNRLKAARESMNSYLKEFGNYQEKRMAIQEEYEKKISESKNSGERMQFMAVRNQKLSDLDFNEWQENGGMALAFGDLEKLSKDTISALISDMEKYRYKIISTFDPEKIQKYEDALNSLRLAESDDSVFGDNDILEGMRERLAIQKQLADEEANELELKRQQSDIEFQLKAIQTMAPTLNLGEDPDGENISSTPVLNDEDTKRAEELRVSLNSVSKALQASTRNSAQLRSQLAKMGKVKFADIKKFTNNLKKAGKNAADLADIFSDELGDAIGSGVDKIGTMFDAFTELSSNIESLSKSAKDTVKDTVSSTETLVEGASSGIKTTAQTTSNSLSTMEKASAIIAIIGAAIQLATMVASLVDPDKKHEKNIEALQERIDALQKSYDKLGKAVGDVYSTDASKLIDQQNTILQQQKILIKQQMIEEQSKKKADKEKIKEYQDQLEEIEELIGDNRQKAKEAIIGEDLKSAINDFASLYAEAWGNGKNAAEKSMAAVKNIISSAFNELLKKNIQPAATRFYDTLAKAMEDGVLTDQELDNLDALKRQIDALADSSEEQFKKIQDRYKDLDELREELTDISFDSVRDNFKDLLSDMESSADDFTDSFSEMLRNALIEGLMDTKYDNMLKEWYDEFAEAMNDRTLTDSERDALRQQYDAIVQQGLEDRDFINSIVGGGAYSQEATSGGWETMGQDQADELNGRFTALTELEAINNSLVSEGNVIAMQILDTLRSLSSLSMVNDGENPTLREIRDMMFLSTGHLEDISKYTKQLITIREGIDKLNDIINQRL